MTVEDVALPFSGPVRIDRSLTWYAAYTQVQSEFRAATEIAYSGLVAYCPATVRTVDRNRRKLDVRRPLFPRYVFAGCLVPEMWGRARRARYVEDLVRGCGAEPLAISPGVVEAFHDAERAGRFDYRRKHVTSTIFRAGQPVQVVSGPYSNFIGRIVSSDTGGRVRMLMGILGGERIVMTKAHQLVAVNDDVVHLEGVR